MNRGNRNGAYRGYLKRKFAASAACEAMSLTERDSERADTLRRLAQAETLVVDAAGPAPVLGGAWLRLFTWAARWGRERAGLHHCS